MPPGRGRPHQLTLALVVLQEQGSRRRRASKGGCLGQADREETAGTHCLSVHLAMAAATGR